MSNTVAQYKKLHDQLMSELTKLETALPKQIARRDELRELFAHELASSNDAPAPKQEKKMPAKRVAPKKSASKKVTAKKVTAKSVASAKKAAAKKVAAGETTLKDPTARAVVHFIRDSPGIGRKGIAEKFGNMLNTKQLSQVLSKCSRAGLIENRGTRASSSWFLSGS